MRFIFCLILWVGLCLLTACRQSDCPPLLVTADSLCNTRPDSAITWLESIQDSITSASKPIQMYYLLLRIKAHDKAYLRHTSDSLILSLVKYYQHNNRQRLPETLYYAGRVYSDLKDAPRALEYYQKAIDILKKENSQDWNLLSRLYSQVGTLFLYQELYNKAEPMFRKAYDCDLMLKDSIGLVYDLRDIGRTLSVNEGHQDSIIYYYNRAAEIALSLNLSQLNSMVHGELAQYYLHQQQYQHAHKSLNIAWEHIDSASIFMYYVNTADYYYQTNNLDSAEYYYQKILLADTHLYQAHAYLGLANIAQKQNKATLALELYKQYMSHEDSLLQTIRTDAVHKINSLYNYQLYKKENEGLKKQNYKQKRRIYYIGTCFLFMLALSIILWLNHKKKEQRILLQQEKLKRIQEKQYRYSQAQISSNQEKIEELSKQLHEAEKENDTLRQNILRDQKEQLENANTHIKATQAIEEALHINLQQTAIWRKLHQSAISKMTENDWRQLQEAIDEAYPRFRLQLSELYPLSLKEMQVCLLLKIEIAPSRIAEIMYSSKQGITSIRKRLYKKLSGKEGNSRDCDEFIRSI